MNKILLASVTCVASLICNFSWANKANSSPRYNKVQLEFLEIVKRYRDGDDMVNGMEQAVEAISDTLDSVRGNSLSLVAMQAFKDYYASGGNTAVNRLRSINRLSTRAQLCTVWMTDGAKLTSGDSEASYVIRGLQIAFDVTPADCSR